jgi:broad specificity phosphatase PhoE
MAQIFLVRHGQVAFGAASYDSLSPVGERQAAAVGSALVARGVTASRTVVGRMNRHRQTASLASRGAGWPAPAEVHQGWDEFDHVAVLSAAGPVEPGDRSLSGPDTLRRFFGVAIPRWSSGSHDGDYAEPFSAFSARVTDALNGLHDGLGEHDTAVVFTSAGVIGWVAASLLNAGEQQWLSLIPVGINGGITRVAGTPEGLKLISYNEHAHLSPDVATFR